MFNVQEFKNKNNLNNNLLKTKPIEIIDDEKYIVIGYQYAMYGRTIKRKRINPTLIRMTEREQYYSLVRDIYNKAKSNKNF